METPVANRKVVLDVFRRTLQLPETGWDSFLDEVCRADTALREQVELRLRRYRELRSRDAVTQAASEFFATVAEAIDRYEPLEQVGAGTMGVVTKCRDPFGRIVAVKKVNSATLFSPEARRRFEIELKAIHALQHPGIVTVYSVHQADGVPNLVMEYIDGGTLEAKLAGGPKDPRWAARVVAQLAEAADYAHGRGIVHRDLTPKNVLLTADDRPKIVDFGIAVVAEEETRITATGTRLGTPAYMAPEQVTGMTKGIDGRADVYALGVILYQALTGQLPFKGGVNEIFHQVQSTDPVVPHLLWPAVPRDLETICLKCLEKEPGRRYPKAGDLADDLGRWLQGMPISARPVGAVGRFTRLCRRHPAISGLVASLILVACFAGGLWRVAEDRRVARDRDRQEAADGMLLEATRFAAEGRFDDALARITSAREAVESLPAAATRGRLDTLEADTRQRRADARLTSALLEARLGQMGAPTQSEYRPLMPHSGGFSLITSQDAYDQALRDYGIDVSRLSAEDAARLIRQSKAAPAIVEALEDWVWVAQNQDGQARVKRSTLLPVLERLETGALSKELRAALGSANPKAELTRLAGSADLNVFSVASLVNLAEALVSENSPELALKAADAAYRRDPGNPFCQNVMAYSLRTQKTPRREEAIGFYRGVIARHPQSVAAILNLAQCLIEQGRLRDAQFEVKRLDVFSPNNQRALLVQAVIHMRLNEKDQAVGCFERAASADGPLTTAALEMLALYATEDGDWKRFGSYAERQLDVHLKTVDPKTEADWDGLRKEAETEFEYLRDGPGLFERREAYELRLAMTTKFAERIVARRPADWDATFLLARLLDFQKRPDDAANYYRRCLSMGSRDGDRLLKAAKAVYPLKQVSVAEKLSAFRAARAARSDPEYRDYATYYSIGDLERTSGNAASAWVEFEKCRRGAAAAILAGQSSDNVLAFHAAAAAAQGRYGEAETSARKQKRRLTAGQAADLVACLAYQGKHREAVDVLDSHRDAVDKNPDLTWTVTNACIEAGDYATATELFQRWSDRDRQTQGHLIQLCQDYQRIRKQITTGEAFVPDGPKSARRRALEHLRMGQYDDCAAVLAQLRHEDLTDLTCHAALVCVLARAKAGGQRAPAGDGDFRLAQAVSSYIRSMVDRARSATKQSGSTYDPSRVHELARLIADARIASYRGPTGFATGNGPVDSELNAAWNDAVSFLADPFGRAAALGAPSR